MASERQIAANRRNAGKSTGPKTRAGRQRARANAYRHGLAAPSSREARAEIDALARQFAGATTDPIILQQAQIAAHAEFILARVELLRIAWIQRTYALGAPQDAPLEVYNREVWAWIRDGTPTRLPQDTMPSAGPERLTEAIRRSLRELGKLERYEARAMARRNRAFRQLVRRRTN
ncbi:MULTISPECIES: hypothetical protein [unclassified Bradyrhizobium]|uniref:hypothetical protein n=1 Tax=unclassified Bradyrhizobium TaxID=2631580 RepID=UPI001FFB7063|nr:MULTISPECIES: hypothetical protein [unclassified Bradyrhizobium]MCK1307790.1 hypothetical protein [Bradyrhizobium sp. 45]MCK1434998.1 hypothetical protein [Bradyrhizobium sp. 15]MCK1578006.1 hypothetical protein [Bradyrhizobium sp. 168]MCK1613500.1 hypothetical protein [Bradyrhizobium sp. 163]MCK1767669.1 hypothetical protein [Bradyrhizobium sp. 136]